MAEVRGNWRIVPGETDTGAPIFSVILKRTWRIVPGGPAVPAEKQFPILETDQYYEPEDPEVASIRYETDMWWFSGARIAYIVDSGGRTWELSRL